MRFSNLVSSIAAQFAVTNDIVPLILGAPGGGKSASAREIAANFLASHGLEYIEYNSANPKTAETATVVEFNAALRDPVDVLGLPITSGDYSRWLPPAEFYALSRPGIKVLILEELSDASVPMQNALCRVIYDKHAGNLKLTDKLYVIATGNRTEDKSGANRIIGKLLGRVRKFDFSENLDDWCEWALGKLPEATGTILVQFLRFKPDMLAAYDPNSQNNSPTPRNWERVSKIPLTLSELDYFEHVKGDVGEGAATEFVAFKKIYMDLPNIDEVLMDPKKAPIPKDLAVRYALAGAIARRATKDNFNRVVEYVERFPNKELNVMAVRDAGKLCPAVKTTRTFVEWATRNAEILM